MIFSILYDYFDLYQGLKISFPRSSGEPMPLERARYTSGTSWLHARHDIQIEAGKAPDPPSPMVLFLFDGRF